MAAKKSLSKTQIDKLGERLKKAEHSEDDLRLLDGYRSLFAAAYELALETIHKLGEFPTGRVAKTTQSISAKLRRESLRLSQMQDIAGCRIIVPDIAAQNQLVAALKSNFPLHTLFDRREKSSHGYRAVHLVVQVLGLPVEIQVRTTLQQSWAELCEKAADKIDSEIKYGGGPGEWKEILEVCSNWIFEHEKCEIVYIELEAKAIAASDKLKQSILAKYVLVRECLDLTVRCEEVFGSFTQSEFSTLVHSDESFRSFVEEIIDDLDLITEGLDLKDQLQTPRSLDQILTCFRRSREAFAAELATDQVSLVDFPPRRSNSSAILESSRTKIFYSLSRHADVLKRIKKPRTENPP